ncbi:response regulator [Thioclava sp. SK-1]|uniref:response regulator n=1 Tax=Thioclava sp. SK-1 TaxID=1889770 RepID=UPI00159F343E|nr:response regulator [Thioclava sp. SK-1]
MANVLLLEDDVAFSEALKSGLAIFGHQVTVVSGAAVALDALREGQFDVVVADIFIRRGDALTSDGGITLAGRLSNIRAMDGSDPRGALPLIVISGAVGGEASSHFFDIVKSLGARKVLAKPFALQDLAQAIAMVLEQGTPKDGPVQYFS